MHTNVSSARQLLLILQPFNFEFSLQTSTLQKELMELKIFL
ncbi:hypothetical protein QE382_002784 [Sphingobacterium zeae]|uniref:Uncharacterized protein n=1 Tax=Sphingobacterium zeae TaxID=1776859 RepID=A0ABU0U752_9SPHI|nr:hypothetical protein [Sphingobacterium zeae]